MKKTGYLCLLFIMCLSLCACSNEKKAEALAQYGEEMFIEQNLSDYTNILKQCGLEDLSVNPNFSYNLKYDYKEEYCKLYLDCSLDLTSSDIDSYYTTTYNSAEGEKLATLMETLLQCIPSSYEYAYEGKYFSGTVVVAIKKPSLQYSIFTPEGREYNYWYDGGGYITVDIDDECVYMVKDPSADYDLSNGTNTDRANSTSSNEDSYGHDKFDAMVIAEKVVKGNLKSPSTAEFCSSSEYTVSCVGNTWTVKGYVDAQNSFGATLRTNFTVKFTFSSSNEYTVDSCSIT